MGRDGAANLSIDRDGARQGGSTWPSSVGPIEALTGRTEWKTLAQSTENGRECTTLILGPTEKIQTVNPLSTDLANLFREHVKHLELNAFRLSTS